MLNENQLNMLPERLYQRLSSINTEYLDIIGKRIKEIGEITPGDVHKLQQLYIYNGDIDMITSKLAKVSEKNIQDIYDIFDIVGKDNYNFSEPFYRAKGLKQIPYEENEVLQKYVKATARQTVNEYMNLTQHTAFAVFDGDGNIAPLFASNKGKIPTSLSDTYTRVIDKATQEAQMGLTDYKSAMRKTLRALADSGIRTMNQKDTEKTGRAGKMVDYATGYSRRLDTAVRQNILWGIKQCNQGVADMVGEDFGANGYEISYHLNPRPTHLGMGGKQYAIGPARTVKGIRYPSFSDVEGLLQDYGCLHFKFSILVGISRPAYSDSKIEEMNAKANETFEYEGKKYTGYEATQVQRKLETEMRHQKDIANIAKAAGDDDLRREAQTKINQLTTKYKEFSDKAGLPTKLERAQVAGFRRVKTQSELWTTQLKGTVAANGVVLNRVSQHFYDRAKERNLLQYVNAESIKKVLTNPIDVSIMKEDKNGLSQLFIGNPFSIYLGNESGNLSSIIPTKSKILKNKYGVDKIR